MINGAKVQNLILIQILISIITTGAVYFSNAQQNTFEFVVGAAFTCLNLVYYGWIFVILMRKKLIALGLSLIVIKYALLAGSLYFLLKTPGINLLWVAAGVGTLVPTVVIVGIIQTLKKDPEG